VCVRARARAVRQVTCRARGRGAAT